MSRRVWLLMVMFGLQSSSAFAKGALKNVVELPKAGSPGILDGAISIDRFTLNDACAGDTKPGLENYCLALGDLRLWDGIIPSPAVLDSALRVSTTSQRGLATTLGGALGGIDQAAILYGTADFLADRAQAELRAWLLDDFFDRLCRKGTATKPQGGDLLPRTCAAVKSGISPLAGGMPSLREDLRLDLQAVPHRLLVGFLSDSSIPAQTRDALIVAIVLADGAEDALGGESPQVALASWAGNVDADAMLTTDFPGAMTLRFVSFFLAAMERSGGEVVIPKGPLELVPALLAAAIPFAARHCEDIGGREVETGCQIAGVAAAKKKVATALEKICANAHQLLKRYEQALLAIEALRTEKTPEDFLKDPKLRLQLSASFETAIGVIVDFADFGIQSLQQLTVALNAKVPEDFRLGLRNARGAVADMRVVVSALASARTERIVSALLTLASERMDVKVSQDALRAISFASEIASASDSESARAALESFAAPIGSYKRKRQRGERRFWLNGFVGAAAGGETPFSDLRDRNTAFAAGPVMQIGPELIFARSRCVFGYYGLFFPLLDVGALASWREAGTDEEVASRPNVGVAQVFAPGAYLTFGLQNAPLTIGLGGSLVPRLREQVVGLDADDRPITRDVDMVRWGVSLSIDIPIFP